MPVLVANVYAADRWWGPSHGNADRVPDDVAATITNPDVWGDGETRPVPTTSIEDLSPDEVDDLIDAITEVLIEAGWTPPAGVVTIEQRIDVDGTVDPAQVAEVTGVELDKNASNESGGTWDDTPTGVTLTADEQAQLAAITVEQQRQRLAILPDHKDTLLRFAAELGIDVDGRLGATKLRRAIADALDNGLQPAP